MVQGLEADVCDLRKRCARFARVTRGEPPENHAPGPQTGSKGGDGQGEECVDWAEIEIHEAKAAMEAERRRALEDEIKRWRGISLPALCVPRFVCLFAGLLTYTAAEVRSIVDSRSPDFESLNATSL